MWGSHIWRPRPNMEWLKVIYGKMQISRDFSRQDIKPLWEFISKVSSFVLIICRQVENKLNNGLISTAFIFLINSDWYYPYLTLIVNF